ncbi:Phosphatidate cytidylyltransferase mitochondrial [Taenia solium]|eukprot:TsM_000225800 transcript=TsM_000225800 gene=TsM_000225800
MPRPHSQLQRQVLKLYKDYMIALRPGSKAKIEESSKSQIRQVVRDEFRKNATTVKKTHFVRIETLVRQGRRLLEDLEAGRIASITTVTIPADNIVHGLFPKNCGLVSAFGYGSVAVPQHGRSAAKSQLDFILIVNDPLKWHTANLKINPNHYSCLASICDGALLKCAVNKWPHPTVYYNPLVTWCDCTGKFPPQVIKYGVVGYESLMSDLNTWCDLYIAGRLHKPVVFVSECEPPPELKPSLLSNLRSALAFSLLQLDLPLLNEDSLYHSLASISYRGDWRLYFGEDKRKIERLITGEPRRHGFRKLYLPLFTTGPFQDLFAVDVPSDLKTDIRIFPKQEGQIVRQLLECLPPALCQLAVCGSSASASHQLSEMATKERRMRLQHAAASIVRRSSYRQTALGLFSAGLSRSVVYSFAKFRKMLASLSS